MQNAGKFLTWHQDQECPVKLVPKISDQYIYLNPYSVACVKFATQILSKSVGEVLRHFGNMEIFETVQYCKMSDSSFDCLNVSSLTEHERKRKLFLAPFTSENDERFDWLQQKFLKHFIDWKRSVVERPGNFTQNAVAKMFISWQTFEEFCITVYSIVAAVKELLSRGSEYVFSEQFCQDPLEEYFGDRRKLGRRSGKPDIVQFGCNKTPYIFKSKYLVHMGTLLVNEIKKIMVKHN